MQDSTVYRNEMSISRNTTAYFPESLSSVWKIQLCSDGQTFISLFMSLAYNTVSVWSLLTIVPKTNENTWLKDRFNCKQGGNHDYHYPVKGYLRKFRKFWQRMYNPDLVEH